LISNLYSSQELYKKSNFYIHLSNYLNPEFNFNNSLLAENYISNKKFDLALKSLNFISEEDLIFSWYKNKKKSSIIKKHENETAALNFLEKKFDGLKTNNIKILYDMGGIYKSFEKYDEAIKIYSKLLNLLDNRSKAYADILYRRGGSFERIGDYETADKDLLESLNITRENPYVLNYLAYSWLERNYKIELSMEMLKEAYDLRKNDPYITDSLGWGYYLINDFENAEKYLKKAVELMPYDPIVNDHYGDILWMLNRKIQARYFWNNVLNLDETEDEMKIDIKKFLKFIPHISFVSGQDNISFLQKRFQKMTENPEFIDMEFSTSFDEISSWAPLITKDRNPSTQIAATRIGRGTDINFEALTKEYLSLVMKLIFAFGLSFQLPVVLSLLARIGVVNSTFLKERRKYVVVIIFAAAAILTPPDPITQIGLGIPLLILYELSIISVGIIEKKAAEKNAQY